LRGLAQFETMSDHETRIDFAALDSIKQALPIMLYVALSGSHGEAAVHERTHGELIDEPALDSNDGDDSSITASHDGFTQRDRPITLGHHGLLNAIVRVDEAVCAMSLEAYGIDAGIGTAASGHFHKRVVNGRYLIVDDVGATLFRHIKSFGEAVDGDNAFGAEEEGTANCELPDWATAPHGDGVAWFDVAHFGAHISGWKNVRKEQDLFVLNNKRVAPSLRNSILSSIHSFPIGWKLYVWSCITRLNLGLGKFAGG